MNTIASSAARPYTTRPKRRWLYWIIRGLLLLAGLAGSGAIYQWIGAARDRATFPAPGRLVDVGGYNMHINCVGTGSPTVVLDTMAGANSTQWGWVQPELAQTTRVCSYDRAGFGWSERAPRPLDLPQTAQVLHTLLERAGERGPFVLVGHSLGGIYVREFAAIYPDEVAGMVLVDASHPEQFDRYPAAWAEVDSFLRVSGSFPLLARLGVARLYFALGGALDFQDLPPRQHDELAMFWSSPAHYANQRAELLNARAIYAQAHQLGSLGNLPLAVVSAGSNPWPELQDDLATLSSDRMHLVVDGASHQSLAFNQRDARQTAGAVQRIVEAARR